MEITVEMVPGRSCGETAFLRKFSFAAHSARVVCTHIYECFACVLCSILIDLAACALKGFADCLTVIALR